MENTADGGEGGSSGLLHSAKMVKEKITNKAGRDRRNSERRRNTKMEE